MSDNQSDDTFPPTFLWYPWLVFIHDKDSSMLTFYNVPDSQYCVKSIIDMSQKTICTSFHGWMVMLDDNSSECFLLNILSKEKIQLPPWEYGTFDNCLLTSFPTDDNCVVAFMGVENDNEDNIMMFSSPGEKEWFRIELDEIFLSTTVCKGTIYVLMLNGGFGILDITGNQAMFKKLDVKKALKTEHLFVETMRFDSHLIESCGEVFLLVEDMLGSSTETRDIIIYRMDFLELDWVHVESLGNRAFFVGPQNNGFSCFTGHGVRENSIYFTKSEDESLYIFDIEKKSIYACLPCPDVEEDTLIQSIWVMPHNTMNQAAVIQIRRPLLPSSESKPKTQLLEEGEFQERDWTSLPNDLLYLVTSHLLPHDIHRLRCTCKTWQSFTWIPPQCPWLMWVTGDTMRCEFFHPIMGRKPSYHLEIPEMQGAVPRFSKYGWVLMSRGRYSIFFLNPFTKVKIQLPDLSQVYEFRGVTFTSPPTSPDCMVCGIVTFTRWTFVWTIRRGDATWKVHHIENDMPTWLSHCNLVFHQEKFYSLSEDGNLVTFDPEKVEWRVHQDPKPPDEDTSCSFLVECDGDLLYVFISFMGELISIFRLDNMDNTWREIDDLGDCTLFLSITTSMSYGKVLPHMENQIYLPMIRGEYVVFYSLVNDQYETFGDDMPREDLYETTKPVLCTWIEPNLDHYFESELMWLPDS